MKAAAHIHRRRHAIVGILILLAVGFLLVAAVSTQTARAVGDVTAAVTVAGVVGLNASAAYLRRETRR